MNVEAGIKGEWRNGAVNASLAAYRIEQSNLPRQTSTSHDIDTISRRDCCYMGVSSKSRGIDAEVCIPVDAVQPGYAVFDLLAGNWRVALSVNNVFDKTYYEALEATLHAWHGEPRSWMLRIDGRY